MVRYDYIAALCVFCVATLQYGSAKIKSFQSNGRVSGVIYTTTVRTLMECSIIYENSETSLSFNFRRDTNSCELSTHYPEHYTTTAVGWRVYARIVDGVWTMWTNWDSQAMEANSVQVTLLTYCHAMTTFVQLTELGLSGLTGALALLPAEVELGQGPEHVRILSRAMVEHHVLTSLPKANCVIPKLVHTECEEMSGTLVIIDEQAEQDLLESGLSGMHHWIGLRCQSGENCAWVDGRNIEGGFINWAPEEPKDRDCVWIGWYTNKWDDDYCDVLHEFICEL